MTYTTHNGKYYIPDRMMGGIERYINDRVIPGNFLQSVISNNLKEAVLYADEENLDNLPAYVGYFYNEAPSGCWGSRKIMMGWLNEADHT